MCNYRQYYVHVAFSAFYSSLYIQYMYCTLLWHYYTCICMHDCSEWLWFPLMRFILLQPRSFPQKWIKGDGYPNGIDRNTELSARDKEHVRRLYGPPRLTPGGKSGPSPPAPQQPEKSEVQDVCLLHAQYVSLVPRGNILLNHVSLAACHATPGN